MKEMIVKQQVFLWKEPKENLVLSSIKKSLPSELGLLTGKQAMLLHDEELVDSELLFGDSVEVIQVREGWKEVACLQQAKVGEVQGYRGWIQEDDSVVYSEDTSLPKVAIIEQFATLTFKKTQLQQEYPFGCIFSCSGETETDYIIQTPLGEALIAKIATQRTTALTQEGLAENMIRLAKKFRGLSYVWGGIGGSGFDCSGFVYSLHRVHHRIIPRDAHEQALKGKEIAYHQALPGDLLFFAYDQGKGLIHHVGLYLGNNEMIHSQTPGSKVLVSSLPGTIYETELCMVRRYWS